MLRKTFPRRDLSRLCPPIWSSTCGSVAWRILGSSLGAEVDLDLQGCAGCVQCAAQSHDSMPTIRVPLQHHAVHQQHLRIWAGYDAEVLFEPWMAVFQYNPALLWAAWGLAFGSLQSVCSSGGTCNYGVESKLSFSQVMVTTRHEHWTKNSEGAEMAG